MGTRFYYRVALASLCAFAAFVGPILFLEDQPRTAYLVGGLAAAFLTWAGLAAAIAIEPHLHQGILMVLGVGAAALSWATISLVAVFDILPLVLQRGLARFDPVWLAGGFSPLVIPLVAWLQYRRQRRSFWTCLLSGLYRFSLPLFASVSLVRLLGLPKQFRWLFLFTGIMFLVLDLLGAGGESPLFPSGTRTPHGADPKG